LAKSKLCENYYLKTLNKKARNISLIPKMVKIGNNLLILGPLREKNFLASLLISANQTKKKEE